MNEIVLFKYAYRLEEIMAAKDYQEDFWIQLSAEAKKRTSLPHFGTPRNGSALPATAGEGVSWVFHFRAKHIRVGIVTYDKNEKRHPNEAIRIAEKHLNAISKLTDREVIIDESRPDSPNGRVYVKIVPFIAEERSTWNGTISDALNCMEVFVELLGPEISG